MLEHTELDDRSPLAAVFGREGVVNLVSEGPVRFLLVSGQRDVGEWGVIGAFWLSIDGERGGFVANPESVWLGSEMARSYGGALRRGWSSEDAYRYWHQLVGAAGTVMIDPPQYADTLLHVYRRVGAL